jgi:hypothetical protein
MGKGHETLSISSFFQASPLTAGGDLSVALRPYHASADGAFRPRDPASTRLGWSSRTP